MLITQLSGIGFIVLAISLGGSLLTDTALSGQQLDRGFFLALLASAVGLLALVLGVLAPASEVDYAIAEIFASVAVMVGYVLARRRQLSQPGLGVPLF